MLEKSRLFTIPFHRSFADALVEGLIKRYDDPMTLAQGLILLPNNRSIRAITEAFVRQSSSGLLLPRMVPVGDPLLDDRLGAFLDPVDMIDPLPPAIPPLERHFRLTRLVKKVMQKQGRTIAVPEAHRLAEELALTLDQLMAAEIAPEQLTQLIDPMAEEELARHWQASLKLLECIITEWPEELKKTGQIESQERRNRLLDRLADRWQTQPPSEKPIIAAGAITGSPVSARLLRVISEMEDGLVVLPGLDNSMSDEEWQLLGPHERDPDTGIKQPSLESHPQFQLKLLLDRMGVDRKEVIEWDPPKNYHPDNREQAIRHVMAPARYTDRWRSLPEKERAFPNLSVIETAHPEEEAQVIALALREAVEEKGQTAALVTPDRALAIRVSALLKRFGIDADDSAGRPLSLTPPGLLLLDLVSLAADHFSAVSFLAIAKHPLVAFGEDRDLWRDHVRSLDMILRGPLLRNGLAGITAKIKEAVDNQKADPELLAWWEKTKIPFQALDQQFQTVLPLTKIVKILRETANQIAGEKIWAEAAGHLAADLIAEIESLAADHNEDMRFSDFAHVLRQLMDKQAVRPMTGGHPRIFIWGLIEARLQHADLMIAASLNETVWPPIKEADPWLAPRIRSELGLPGLELRIGIAAHDFSSVLGAKKILLTRARRDARAPTMPSRFWLRLEAMAANLHHADNLPYWARQLDEPQGFRPVTRPAPNPPVLDRPKRIAVTRFDSLQSDPYSYYASNILGLRKLDPVDAEPTAAWRGSLIHSILENWVKEDNSRIGKLKPRALAFLESINAHIIQKTLWLPRLLQAIDWIEDEVQKNAAEGRTILDVEREGRSQINGIELFGFVDRIDRMGDGSLAIVDYKTGTPPSAAAVRHGDMLQLALLGLLIEHNGIKDIKGQVSAFEYWSMAQDLKKKTAGYSRSVLGSGKNALLPEDFLNMAEERFIRVTNDYLHNQTPFTARPHRGKKLYDDYVQLMRFDEWRSNPQSKSAQN
ncbi:double-strand break repair protein AddB [Zymomonas mobilis]|uniref:double-strand break repair protein AddB n=1 Tax=Zymomonas mobilis TaxID=542 RepID=UPI0003C7603E|nr:double-strand break repair protein AddB [Zymomonas mobilis]AHB09557.1 double-strand break repair protein AddB, alphaproteobacterial type [Zymomonas mobilis subsp. mobilis str. CP4 = NRRL B-14023]AHJ69864.1 Inactivated superfamily I helicase [Zymomonas mobilis subsp. mobilis NRRL B-12526]AHJ71719.1 Inactivated superfamily I helicase [Zymomonas mobilis subsp. mobilis str. CP4 = NRRL B-14023]TWE25137.1 ATP-dependent helicase/nuclease subunit B [Zymomonas mobilis]